MIPRLFFLFLFFFSLSIHSQSSTQELIDSLNTIEDHDKKVELCRKIALSLKSTDWERAVKYIELAEAEAKKTPQSDLALASVYTTAGEVYDSKDVLDVSLQYYLKAYDIYKEKNNIEEAARVENNLAILYAKSNNQEKALKFFAHVYKYQKEKKDSAKLVKILNNIGTIYLEKNADSSLYYYQKANAITDKLKDKTLTVYIYTNLARAYILKNDKQNVNLYFEKAFSVLNSIEENSLKSFVYEAFSEYNLKEKKLDLAIANAKLALEFNKEKSFGFSSMRLNKMLYDAYLSKGDYKNAVYYFQQYNKISDSINIEQKAVNLERIRLEQDYKVRSQIQKLVEEKTRFKYYVTGLILVIGILSLILLLIRYRNRNIKNQLEKEKLKAKEQELKQSLEAKNMVLVGKAMAEIHRTDNINEILTDLKKIKLKTPNKELQQAIDIVLKRLEKDLNTDIWKEFEISFEQVHKSFFDKLTIDYPTLTPKERRLCALLYLDLTTKEISQITGQSFKSIENARTRLRKKFDLTNEKVNLSTYLNSFKGESL
ncbi:DNA-binding CsgD family transcriptional regulator [Flavobacterium nitrogenifigens]|uniref:DNA-binding CsgD family transcriptional regulator n=2 Tax=Flavobacterium TaxID=237 RepID=A0A7W7IXB6_9FLAO|nr:MULTISPECIES: LuxR C-terminal-related transcriptional regulator [Flavobacterium]MBB4802334.1 DNA-binding CsgD family transcriptional regulator [Flavobacterium nitrogenifigens]MBB6387292.1 DNA-binding CsgD family transcriptional regulator [Flavobacterium notoginsengisoli]